MSNPIASFALPNSPSMTATPAEEKVDAALAANPEAPVVLTAEEMEAMGQEAARINEALEALTERKEDLKRRLRALDYGTTTLSESAGVKVTIGKNPIFQELKFREEFPYDKKIVGKVVRENPATGKDEIVEKVTYPNRELYKISVDRPQAKATLGAEAYAEFFEEGAKKVTIK